MPRLPRALAGLRDRVFARRTPARHTSITAVSANSPQPARHPSPEMWAALLAGSRRRRAPNLWPITEPTAAPEDAGSLVRAYVLSPWERARLLAAPTGEAQ